MKIKCTLFRRGGIYYSQDSATGQQKSLRTRGQGANPDLPPPDQTEASKLISARNEMRRQPVHNLAPWP